MTAEVEKMNSSEYGRPPSTFRPGHPTPRKGPKATRTATGFQVQFASHATITTPTVYERAVIVSGGFNSKELYAFNATTGDSLWALDLNDDGPSSPACERGVCVISTESCTVFAIAADTGKHLWSHWLGDPLTSAPTIAGDRVFASYPARGGETEDDDGGDKPHPPGASHALAAFGSVSSMQNFQGSRIVKLRDRSVNTMGDEVLATDSDTGATLWSFKLDGDLKQQGGFLGTAPLATGTSIMVGTLAGEILRLDQKTGKKVASYEVGGKVRSQPVVANGWIYVGTEDGRLVAINTKDPTVTGWSTWGGNAQRTRIAQ